MPDPSFEARLLNFINESLPRLDRRQREWPPVDVATPLFSNGLLDSMSILHLIAFIEQATGRTIPDRLVVMKNFQTPRAIVEVFAAVEEEVHA
jgi:acyl carrier protein